ncbi:Signal peptidase complex subunit 2 [Podochytrium sp. JEL0797]|nr:Signal peptidase complex subunit 2 [Podochytrium sp. JEL0797]
MATMTKTVQSAFVASLEQKPVIINNYNIAEVKHALDDAVRKILAMDHKFVENHTHTDLKLLLGFTSCFFAIGGALYGHFNDFQESKLIVLVCVVVYSILNGAMLGYGMFIEKDVVFVGTRKDPIIRTDPIEKVIVNAKCKKATAEYTVTVHVTGKKELKNTMTKSFGAWFDEDGELVAENLAGDISSLLVDKKSQ